MDVKKHKKEEKQDQPNISTFVYEKPTQTEPLKQKYWKKLLPTLKKVFS